MNLVSPISAMNVVENSGGAGAARPGAAEQGDPSPTGGSVALSGRVVDGVCWLLGYVTSVRRGLEGVYYYAAKDYDGEIEGRRRALEEAVELGKFGISSYLEQCGIRPDSVEAGEYRHGHERAYGGKIRFYVKTGSTVHVFEEFGEGRGLYLGEFTTEELEEHGV